MKLTHLILALTLLASSSASAFELYSKADNTECTVIGTTVTKKTSYLYGTAGYTTTKEIQPFGFEPIAQKAAAASKGISMHVGYLYLLKIDGVNYGLNAEDSTEALLLLSFVQQVCSN